MTRVRTFALWLPLLLALVAGSAGAAPAAGPQTPQVAAQGTGEVAAAPDRAIVRFGVQFQAADAQAAQGRVNEAMQRVIQALHRLNIPQNRISTERLDLSPVYSAPGPIGSEAQPRLVGYRASNVVRVQVDDIARVGAVIDSAVGAGANNVEGIEFAVANEAPYRARALERASQEARAKAQAIAGALGVQLGDLIEASEGSVEVTPIRPLFAERAAATPIQPGEITVRATVTVRYAVSGAKKEP
jgi:uncharacterized protein YggE